MNQADIKSKAKSIIGPRGIKTLRGIYSSIVLRCTYRIDRIKYKKHSSVFCVDTLEKLECKITLLYHGIEKGFLHNEIRPYFAREKVISLLKYLEDNSLTDSTWKRCHFQSAIANLCNYYEWHESQGYALEYFPEYRYAELHSRLIIDLPSVRRKTKEEYFSDINASFAQFAKSRSSVREFSSELVSHETLKKVVELANTAPSVCNRQGVSVIVVENKSVIKEILDIQKGLAGYTSINQLIVLTANRNYFYSVGERNQLYIDGGIYLMNLLYALHSYGIAACPAHWGLLNDADQSIERLIGIPKAAQVICIISFGYPKEVVKSTLSLRRKPSENLVFVEG